MVACSSIPLRAARVLAAAALLLFAPGCAPLLTEAIGTAPNRFNPLAGRVGISPLERSLLGYDQAFRVDVGPPAAKLYVYVMEPADEFSQPRATVLVVHGVKGSSFWMRHYARAMSEAGYRAVLVDLRGHGRSSGGWQTYGVREAEDLVQVVDELDRRKLIAGRLGVLGISYGATTSIHLAALDPRIEAVVAVAPFADFRQEVPQYLDATTLGASRLLSDATIEQSIEEVGRRGGFDPNQARARDAIAQSPAPVLLVHGDEDWLVPPEHGISLHEAAPGRSELVLVPGEGHFGVFRDRGGEIARGAVDWFDWYLGCRPATSFRRPEHGPPAGRPS